MTLGSILITIIIVAFIICMAASLAACRLSGQISRDEEAGAPEGWHQPRIN